MAQVLQRDDIVSLWAQGVQAVKDKSYSSAGLLLAKEISIVWGSDSRCWKWVSKKYPISSQALEVAELINVCWLQIDGNYNADYLMKGVKYGVYFFVELHNNLCMNGPVTLKLTRPNGTTEEHNEDLNTKPKNTVVVLKVGEFSNTAPFGSKNTVKFSMNGCDGINGKTGLTIICAILSSIS